MGGRRYAPQPVRYAYMPDPTLESARTVVVKLHHRVGRYVKLQLHFRTRWILLSEVSFDSGGFCAYANVIVTIVMTKLNQILNIHTYTYIGCPKTLRHAKTM